jgi:hypothetical protein
MAGPPSTPPPVGGYPSPYGPTFGAGPDGWRQPSRSGKAIAALVLGILSLLFGITIVLPLLAIVFGVLALREIGRGAGAVTGRGMAVTGLVLGVVGLVIGGVLIALIGNEVSTTTGVQNLEVGQCVDLPDVEPEGETVVFRLDDASCDEPHDGEVFFVGEVGSDGDEFPGARAVDDEIIEQCLPEFERYVGLAYEQSEFDFTWIYPTADSWDLDRGFTCLVTGLDGARLDESVRGSGR